MTVKKLKHRLRKLRTLLDAAAALLDAHGRTECHDDATMGASTLVREALEELRGAAKQAKKLAADAPQPAAASPA